VAKPELGTKRLCASCGAKFYDLNHDPIVCPKCGTVYEVAALTARARPESARAAAKNEEAEAIEPAEAEIVSLEEADEETTGSAKKPAADEVEDDDIEIDDDEADDTFLDDEEDEDDDVSDIIGDGLESDEES